MRLSISEELVKKVLNYISRSPYVEVAKLMSEVQADIKPVLEAVPSEDKKLENK